MSDQPPAWFTSAVATPAGTGQVEVDGVPIVYRTWGEPGGPGVLLVHGGAAHARWWDHVAPLLVEGSRRVVAVDLSGHGDSGRAPSYDLDRWAAELRGVIGAAGLGERPTLIGHSMGGFVTLTAALRHGEELAGAVAVDSPVRERSPEERAARQRRAFGPARVHTDRDALLARFRTVPEQDGDLPWVHRHIAEHSIRAVDGGWSWKFDPKIFGGIGLTPGELGRPGCRIALFRAEYGLVPADMGEMVVDRMGRAAPVVEIPGAGHHVMIDQPLALVTALRTLLADWEHSVPVVAPRSRVAP
ncbi:putative hydrolase [Pseudonocardia sp. Ae168_Ps1]|uniref:alpha/beta fold hydrolase n=1 Tax=unclassified Pseudonocardia TaxID=2619320 RepID=UPI00094AD57D|nr:MULTISPECIES: alpha/beta hydrolase [unclassified Pseudonocardia]OLL73025.1 putative hydrolase [Pseudonocardia sp. Ae150A_Ps1]OLL79000.1 putative hydrolase [Pseudonocardia sp. Ae168_Ps1]OLL86862.1 putative hydrolase [Pseudonocardia sp. Ae263_Ps1]OLL93094.1 putative hydrolase [Pseudonocardia sp. Ae356_Ps1]